MTDRSERLGALAALSEPLRRRLYLHVAASSAPVGRDAAADAVGVARSTAAFHLDKLAELGLLEVEYRRPQGRGGPGAGRPAKLYRRAEREVTFTVPERHYDVAASLLAQAVADAQTGGVPVEQALHSVARDYGRAIGSQVDDAARGSGTGAPPEVVIEVLSDHGYEPCRDAGTVLLRNCPFHRLAEEHRELVCGMNLDVVCGVLEGLGVGDASARLDPSPDRCCVKIVA